MGRDVSDGWSGGRAQRRLETAARASAARREHVLVVEDEEDLRNVLKYNLEREGYRVSVADSGEKALELVRREVPDLVLLDLMLPGMNGLEVCRVLKSQEESRQIPVVMVTAKGEEADIVVGLELGADDYVTKPFSPRVLLARIGAVLRRKKEAQRAERLEQPAIRVGQLEIIPEKHQVRVAGREVGLTATEFRLLYLLASRPGRVFTRQQIIEALHGKLAAVTDRSVDVQIVTLRKKLGEAGQEIQTVRGVGYRFREPGGEG